MSDTANLYQSPQTSANPVNSLNSQGVLTETMLTYLREAAPWLRFLGILSFIGGGFSVLAGILFLLAPGLSDLGAYIPGWSSFGGALGVFYFGIAALVFFIAWFTYNFGTKIRHYMRSGAETDLELAFKNNKSLWKLNGILAIVYLALIPVVVVIAVVVTIYTASL